jgi:hypothetical protein
LPWSRWLPRWRSISHSANSTRGSSKRYFMVGRSVNHPLRHASR